MNKPLKEASKTYFDNQSISDAQFENIEELVRGLDVSEPKHESTPGESSRRRLGMFSLSTAALVMLVALATLVFPPSEKELSYVIAKEVAKNHIKLKPLEISSPRFDVVSDYFTELDFSPVPSGHFSHFNVDMLGGRYCSIQSVTAAQLRYEGADGKPVTLYEVGYNKDIFGPLPNIEKDEEPAIYYVNGLEVQIWIEKGLLMASVRS